MRTRRSDRSRAAMIIGAEMLLVLLALAGQPALVLAVVNGGLASNPGWIARLTVCTYTCTCSGPHTKSLWS